VRWRFLLEVGRFLGCFPEGILGRGACLLVLWTAPAAGDVAFVPTLENPGRPSGGAPEGMVWVPGGQFSMGAEDPRARVGGREAMADARPIHRVYVDGFWMDRTTVTNEEFERFVKATGYRTLSEQAPRPEDFPGAAPETLVPGSVVFEPPTDPVSLDDFSRWWRYVPGANWRHPRGPGSTSAPRDPVVHVAYSDACAYAAWAGKRLPTEAEWEFAARGGLAGQLFVWGDRLRPAGKWMANTYQGHFPQKDTGADGFRGLAPVAQFPPNRYGLYDMSGNVWQWTSDWYRPDYYAELSGRLSSNPHGPDSPFDPAEPGARKRVQRGGSFLCTEEYCVRYVVGTRGKGEVGSGGENVGFRCVRDAQRPSH
jgi:sulfatase modifying factor 1